MAIDFQAVCCPPPDALSSSKGPVGVVPCKDGDLTRIWIFLLRSAPRAR
jgi:hypothetical protein